MTHIQYGTEKQFRKDEKLHLTFVNPKVAFNLRREVIWNALKKYVTRKINKSDKACV